jgi:methyl-accepting chemotaxis protein
MLSNLTRNLLLKQKLGLAFGFALVAGLLGFFLLYNSYQDTLHQQQTTLKDSTAAVDAIQEASLQSSEMGFYTATYIASRDPKYAVLKKKADDACGAQTDLAEKMAAGFPEHASLVEKIKKVHAIDDGICNKFEDQALDLASKGRFDEAKKVVVEQWLPARAQLVSAIDDAEKAFSEADHRLHQRLHTKAQQSMWLGIAVMLIGGIASLSLGMGIASGLSRSLNGMVNRIGTFIMEDMLSIAKVLDAMAAGELLEVAECKSQFIKIRQKDEFGQLALVYDRMLESTRSAMAGLAKAQGTIAGMIAEIHQAASHLMESSLSLSVSTTDAKKGAKTVAEGSEKLAYTSMVNANEMRELASAITQIGVNSTTQYTTTQAADELVRQTSQAIKSASSSAADMSEIAESADHQVRETMTAMNRIQSQSNASAAQVRLLDQRSEEVGRIAVAIEAIAEQTNLLALNAAIEAARAGEHGRGFAVVAEEVRKLAEQSRDSTVEINQLISSVRQTVSEVVEVIASTNHEVQAGVEKTELTGAALRKITESSKEVSVELDLVSRQSTSLLEALEAVRSLASEGQSSITAMTARATTVSENVETVSITSQESAAAAEELSASTHEVQAESARLREMADSLLAVASKFSMSTRNLSVTETSGPNSKAA